MADALNRLTTIEFADPGPGSGAAARRHRAGHAEFQTQPGLSQIRRRPALERWQRAAIKGAWGKGLKFADVEYSWQINHEDLEIAASQIMTGGETLDDPFNDTNHGTAVLGEIHGKNNGYGVTGIAPDAVVFMAPANTFQSGYSPARAIGIATGLLSRGDVIVIEQQYWACGAPTSRRSMVRLRCCKMCFDAISAATAKGIVVAEAAGNGNINLDSPSCNNLFNRSFRDSGAIIVGAGSLSHAKMSFSSFGSRVDVQGWGTQVMTTGYGDQFFPGSDVAAGLHRLVQRHIERHADRRRGRAAGQRHRQGLRFCSPQFNAQMRKVLAATGTPQSDPGKGKIGPLPNIKAAVRATKAKACFNAQ